MGENEATPDRLDVFDRKIVNALRANGRLSMSEFAAKVGLSKTPCQVQFRRLIDHGLILGFSAILDPVKLNVEHVAFAEIKLSNTQE